jgi:hypothetical protein
MLRSFGEENPWNPYRNALKAPSTQEKEHVQVDDAVVPSAAHACWTHPPSVRAGHRRSRGHKCLYVNAYFHRGLQQPVVALSATMTREVTDAAESPANDSASRSSSLAGSLPGSVPNM